MMKVVVVCICHFEATPPTTLRCPRTHLVVHSVHFVDSDDELFDSQQVDHAGVLAGLSLHRTDLLVSLLNGNGVAIVGGDHQHANVGLDGAGNHVLDEIPVA